MKLSAPINNYLLKQANASKLPTVNDVPETPVPRFDQADFSDRSSLDNAHAYVIYRVARRLRMSLNQYFKGLGYDLGQEQWFILFRLKENPGVAQVALTDPVLNDQPNITRLVDSLVKKGWVERRPSLTDRRKHCLFLTEEGITVTEALLDKAVEERKRLFGDIDPEELAITMRTLEKIEQKVV